MDRDKTGDREDQARGLHGRLNPDARVPLYHQIFVLLRNRIYGGVLTPATRARQLTAEAT